MKVKINNRKTVNYLIILVIGIIICSPLLSKKLNIYFGNGLNDIAEGYEFSKNFEVNEGKILSSFFYSLGTGNTFLKGPLSIFILFLGNYFFKSYIYTYKIIAFFSVIFSAIYMHKFVEKVTQDKNISLLSAIIYMSAPFHLNQVFINNSIRLSLSFVFIPMIFLGLYKILNTTEHGYHFGFGITGLILTDFNLFLITFIAIFIYLIINLKNIFVEHSRKELFINIIAIIGITSFFIFPLFEVNLNSNYILNNNNKIIGIKNLFVTSNNSDFVYELGPHIIIMLAFSIMTFTRLRKNRKEYIFSFIMMIFYLILSLRNTSNFLIISIFFEGFVCALNMSVVLKKFRLRDVLIISLIAFFYLLALKDFIPYSNSIEEIKNYDLSQIVSNNPIPKKSSKKENGLNSRGNDISVIKGSGIIRDKSKYLTYYRAKVDTLEEDTIYEFPYLYYPGYKVTYDGIVLDYFESDNGLVAVKMNKEDGTLLEVEYKGTKLMNITKIISFTSLVIFSYYVYKKH